MKFVRSSLLAIAFVVVFSSSSTVKAQQWSCDVNTSAPCTTTGSVGIGVPTPSQKLEVADTNAIKLGSAYISSGIPSANHAAFASNAYYNGGGWIIPNSTTTSQLLQFYNGATWFYGTQTPGAADWQAHMVIGGSGNVGIGTTDPCNNAASATVPNCKLSVNGGIQAQAVVINSNWSDYVFAPDYRLAPLSEVADYIKDNHHLPGIPSESEVQQTGVSLGDMQSKLLAKIEELTLHMIEADERNSRLEQQNQDLLEQNQAIRKEIETLKTRMSK